MWSEYPNTGKVWLMCCRIRCPRPSSGVGLSSQASSTAGMVQGSNSNGQWELTFVEICLWEMVRHDGAGAPGDLQYVGVGTIACTDGADSLHNASYQLAAGTVAFLPGSHWSRIVHPEYHRLFVTEVRHGATMLISGPISSSADSFRLTFFPATRCAPKFIALDHG
jgi:hypothetical protein